MADINLNKAEFVKSAASSEGFIRDSLPRIVFAGKSNVGKSSVINRLLNRKNFARVGSQPGKTIHVNYFKIDGRSGSWTCRATVTPPWPRRSATAGESSWRASSPSLSR